LYREIWTREVNLLGETLVRQRCPDEATLHEWIEKDPYFVVEAEGRVVAVLGCESRHGTLHLVHLATHPEYRRRGFARALMKKAELHAREIGAAKIWFDTAPGLEASSKLYESLGYTRCGLLRRHYWGTDIILYEKLL
jgi:ribosomal protein S18 acetylase RimI-like enzyme